MTDKKVPLEIWNTQVVINALKQKAENSNTKSEEMSLFAPDELLTRSMGASDILLHKGGTYQGKTDKSRFLVVTQGEVTIDYDGNIYTVEKDGCVCLRENISDEPILFTITAIVDNTNILLTHQSNADFVRFKLESGKPLTQ